MTKVLQRPTLILNRNWQPVNVATVARALVLLWNESARVVDPKDFQLCTWEDWAKLRPDNGEDHIQAVRFKLRVPEVVALSDYDRLPVLAAELVRRPVTALVSVGGEPSAMAAKAATATIPIVSLFTDDPVERGIVASLNRPGGNVTGVSLLNGALEAKRLGLLHEIVPKAATLGVLLNRSYPGAASQLRDMQEAAGTIGLQLHVFNAGTDPEIDTAFETIAQNSIPALVVAVDPFFTTRRDQGGTGLGLHIVYSIVTNRLGGRLDLDSEPGGGTRIRIVLPRVAPLEQAAE